MVTISEYCDILVKKYGIKDKNFPISFIFFMNRNNWFGTSINKDKNTISLNVDFSKSAIEKIEDFCLHYQDDYKDKFNLLIDKLKKEMPKTAEMLITFKEEQKLTNETSYNIVDALFRYLAGEITLSTDKEIESLIEDACENLNVEDSRYLAFFIAYVKEKYNTVYQNIYTINKRVKVDTSAYNETTYLHIIYKLFNEDYINDNCMLYKASQSKDYVDTWIYMSIHFISAIRNTDIELFPHPLLPKTPEVIVDEVANDNFEKWEAEYVVNSLLTKIRSVNFKPNKTRRINGIADIKFFVPTSCVDLFGTLFALAESHYQINKTKGPLIRVISNYDKIKRYMGEDIGDLFLEQDFKSRSANKSYLQMINDFGKEIIGDDDNYSVKGYMLAALARSHKHSFNHFAKTTFTYLKDAKMNGHSLEFITRELFERGVLSYFSSTLLRLLTNGEYDDLTVSQQTQMIKFLGISNNEIDSIFCVLDKVKNDSYKLAKQLCTDRKLAIQTLHSIANGNAFSKQTENDCIMTALKKVCPNETINCINCQYQIKTKATLISLLGEFNKHKEKLRLTNDPLLKARAKHIITSIIAPAMDEMITCLKETYGDEAVINLNRIIEHG